MNHKRYYTLYVYNINDITCNKCEIVEIIIIFSVIN